MEPEDKLNARRIAENVLSAQQPGDDCLSCQQPTVYIFKGRVYECRECGLNVHIPSRVERDLAVAVIEFLNDLAIGGPCPVHDPSRAATVDAHTGRVIPDVGMGVDPASSEVGIIDNTVSKWDFDFEKWDEETAHQSEIAEWHATHISTGTEVPRCS
tara:strand:- start:608 stop:1078 length:471 start_codon:yes stop_codon:yes gene_type:complete